MDMLPDSMRLSPALQTKLDGIRSAAKVRHEKTRKAARRNGRVDFPMLPYECSWAYEQQFIRENA